MMNQSIINQNIEQLKQDVILFANESKLNVDIIDDNKECIEFKYHDIRNELRMSHYVRYIDMDCEIKMFEKQIFETIKHQFKDARNKKSFL